jgi:hypothetical protein
LKAAKKRSEELEAEQQRMLFEMEAEWAQWEAERESYEKRFADMLQFMQALGAHTGVAVPPGLMAPPIRPPHANATNVSKSHTCKKFVD